MVFVVRWLGPGLVVAHGLFLVFVLMMASVLGTRLVDREEHWWLKNNRFVEGRRLLVALAALGVVWPVFAASVVVGQFSAVGAGNVGVATAAGSAIAAALILQRFHRRHTIRHRGVSTPWERMAGGLVLFIRVGLILAAVGAGIGTMTGVRMAIVTSCLVMLAASIWWYEAVLERLHLLRPAPDQWRGLAAAAACDTADLLELRTDQPNAYALTSGRIALSNGLVSILDHDQILAVLRHERGHASHLDFHRRAAVVQAVGSVLAVTLGFRGLLDADIGAMVLAIIPLVVILVLVTRLNARRRATEVEADHHANHGAADPAFGRALLEIYRHSGAALSQRHPTHPPAYERVVAAGFDPGFPEPGAPSPRGLLAVVPLVIVVAVLSVLPTQVAAWVGPEPGAAAALATGQDRNLYLAYEEARLRLSDSGVDLDQGASPPGWEQLISDVDRHRAAVELITTVAADCEFSLAAEDDEGIQPWRDPTEQFCD